MAHTGASTLTLGAIDVGARLRAARAHLLLPHPFLLRGARHDLGDKTFQRYQRFCQASAGKIK